MADCELTEKCHKADDVPNCLDPSIARLEEDFGLVALVRR